MKKIFHILILTIIFAQNTLQASQPAKSILGKRKDIQDTTQLDERPVKLQKQIDTQLDNQLIDAVKTNNIPATARLLREGANPNVKDEYKYPILAYAVKNIPILSLLLNHQADVNIQDRGGYTPLSVAAGANIGKTPHVDAITLLLDKSADINLPSSQGHTPLMAATFFNPENIALQIINMFFDAPQKLNVNAQDENGFTVLMTAAAKGYAKIAHFLLEKGADWKLANINGKTAEDLARHYGKDEVVATIKNFKKLQASGHREALRSIAQQVLQSQWHVPGPKPASGGLKGKAQNISIPVASFLRPKAQQATRPTEVNVVEEVQSRERKGMQDTTQLDERQIKVQKLIDDQLIDAVKTNNVPATARLLREGANPDIRDGNGVTILGYAIGNIPILSLLLNHQADVNIQEGDGYTPLSKAAGANILTRSYIDALTLLLDKSADINLPSNLGLTPLMFAIYSNTEDIALQIINMFFDAPQTLNINAQDNKGNTALTVAATKGYARVAHLLLEKGADWKLANKSDKTAEDIARALGKNEVVATIEKFKKLQEPKHREALRSFAEKVLRKQWDIPGPKPASGGLKGTAQVISSPVASFLRPKVQQATRPAEVNAEEEKQEADIQNLGE